MGLKQLIKQQKILAGGYDVELTLEGEPLIYSLKYKVGKRHHPLNFFRDLKWSSLLKCYYRHYYNTKIPVVLLIKLYVSPPSYVFVKKKDLVSEKVPAVMSFELCDYLLSFKEMLHKVLFNSYRQVVRVEIEKWYSDNPRTVFRYMKWEHYVNFRNNNTADAKTKSCNKAKQKRILQSEYKGHEHNKKSGAEETDRASAPIVSGPSVSDCPFPFTCTSIEPGIQQSDEARAATYKEAGRRQPGEVPK
jgi:hypothetical protein